MVGINFDKISKSIQNNFRKNNKELETVFNNLATGLKTEELNSAIGAIEAGLAADAAITRQGVRNGQNGFDLSRVADSALESISNATIRLEELALQASNGTYSDTQREALNTEFSALKAEIDRVANATDFNGQKILEDDTEITLQVGKDSSQSSQLSYNIGNIKDAFVSGSIGTQSQAQSSLAEIRNLRDTVNSARGDIGAFQSRVNTAIDNGLASEEVIQSARSRIISYDVAEGTASLARLQVLNQAGTALQAQANQNLSASIVQRLLS